jgi:glycine/D-amino acid oxidase-like deaminating enzyme
LLSRRELLKTAIGISALSAAASGQNRRTKTRQPHIVVVGASAFGGWTALHLLRSGARITLLDAWGPGNSRASSGGETRVIRATYGRDRIYSEMTARSLVLWKEHQRRWRRQLFHPAGVLWMVSSEDDSYERAALPILRDLKIEFEELSSAEIGKRYPQINPEGIRWAIYERNAGYLLARQACAAVVEAFEREGGEYRQITAERTEISGGEARSIRLSDGSAIAADQFVFACGPWLPKLFADVLGDKITSTRQEVFFFGTPAGDARFDDSRLPVWIDHGNRFMYGIPGNQHRGFKVADDTRGPHFDPTSGERTASEEGLAQARQYLESRFPVMKGAPLLEARVCQYENSPDNHFIVDRHPRAENLWLVGGGSGHGFKHGPALGEMVAAIVLGTRQPKSRFQLARFNTSKASEEIRQQYVEGAR